MSENEQQERPFEGFGDSSGYEGPLQDGRVYPATLTDMSERFIEKGQWPGWKVIWNFAIEGRTHTEPIEAMTSAATGDQSTARPWLIALVGRQRFDERREKPIKKSELVGRECSLLVQFNEGGWPRVSAVMPRQDSTEAAHEPPPPPPPASKAEDFDDLPF